MSIHIIAILTTKNDTVDILHEELKSLVKETQKETACFQYELHQDIESPNIFIMLEEWENEEGIKKHNESDHFLAFLKKSETLMLTPLQIFKTLKSIDN
ncbi:putative quinol monooxygenase [Chryseobacterium sp. ISL-6]|uniref:putative quinol monooxygenase n=1 Tax=Chryseobacterium sp. ISL-6 TaxID=2819143 RepID=UPI001BECE95C|nr:putative quinol monooxygenase [Chryseobacterium sp. ISL-6]MBT2623699.1 antibiotic biosynthesis monooxygenase [Chryseobacterium sp. ISL-6]